MADVEDRIYDLTAQATPDDTDVLFIDNATNVEPHQITYANLISPEETARDNADTAIKTGAGLEADGSMTAVAGSNYLKNSDFIAAGYAVNLLNGERLLDTAIANIAAAATMQVQCNLTSSEILALNKSPVVKVVAPTASKFYQVDRVIAKNNFVTTAYTTAGANGIYLRYTGAADYIAHLSKTFVESAATTRMSFEQETGYVIPLATGLEFYAPDGNPVNGDGTISVLIDYKINNDFIGISTGVATGCCVYPIADTFDETDLSGLGNLVINHALNTRDVVVFIWDNRGVSVATTFAWGNEAGADTMNYVTVTIGAGIPGTWRYLLLSNNT